MKSNFRPIETAPKDGRTIVGLWISNGNIEHEEKLYWRGGKWCSVKNGVGFTPDHWVEPGYK